MTIPNALTRSLATLAIVSILGGCSTLPRDGPTGSNVERGATGATTTRAYQIVDLDYATSERIKASPPQFFGSLIDGTSNQANNMVGVGDILAVSIFEPGGSLFNSGSSIGPSQGMRSSSGNLPGLVVDANGMVSIPFGGEVHVAGLSPQQAAAAVRRSLAGKVANPQVLVAVSENNSNTVTVLGEVRAPGRAALSANADRIIDVIAARGGAARASEDIQVVIQRNGQTFSAPMIAVTSEFNENIRLARGDQVNLTYKPRRYSTFGALGAVSQTDLGAGALTLAGAISRVGGLDTNSANARSVLVFRFERPEVAAALGLVQPTQARGVPVIYRLNLEEAEGFFIANNFQIQPDDILYVPRSGSAELGKFFTLIRSISGVIYDVSVTNTLSN